MSHSKVAVVLLLTSCGESAEQRALIFERAVTIEPSGLAPDCTPDAESALYLSTELNLTTADDGILASLTWADDVAIREGISTQLPVLTNRIEVEVGSELCLETSGTSTNGIPGGIEEARSCQLVDESTSTLLFSLPAVTGGCTITYSAFATVEGSSGSAASPGLSDFYHGVVFGQVGYFSLTNIIPDCEDAETFLVGDEVDAEIDSTLYARTGLGEIGLITLDDARFVEGIESAYGTTFEWLEGTEGGSLCIRSSMTEELDTFDDDWLEEDEQCVPLSREQPRMEFDLNMTRDACTLNFRVGATWFGEKQASQTE